MADYRSMYDSQWIYAFDLAGRDVVVTIGEVKAALVKDSEGKAQKKPVVFFRESKDKRGLVLCKTNGKTIASLYGSDTDKWIGRKITLFPTQVSAFGQTVDAIRIRPTLPKGKGGDFAETPSMATPEAPELAGIENGDE